MTKIYALFHTNPTLIDDEERLIGAFLTTDSAASARTVLSTRDGFRDHPTGFVIDEYETDEDNWSDGFILEGEHDQMSGDQSLDPLVDYLDIDANPNTFVLTHRRLVGMYENSHLIGFYSNANQAALAAKRSAARPGFRSFLHGFVVCGLAIDVIHWSDGFRSDEATLQRLLSCTLPSEVRS